MPASAANIGADASLAKRRRFFAGYTLVTALQVPGVATLTLAAGPIFGLWWGILIVSFASSTGATLAFLTVRLILRGSIQQRFGD